MVEDKTLWLKALGIEPVWRSGSVLELVWVQAGLHDAKGWLMNDEMLALP